LGWKEIEDTIAGAGKDQKLRGRKLCGRSLCLWTWSVKSFDRGRWPETRVFIHRL